MTCLIYIHIGKNLPEYIYDSIYQSILVSSDTRIYVILDDTLITKFNKQLLKFNNNIYTKNKIDASNLTTCIPLSILQLPQKYVNFINNLPDQTKSFRDSFWIYTIARFFYLENFMSLFNIKSAFHIENDIMIYENLKVIESTFDLNKMYMIKDSEIPSRVIASLMYLNNLELKKLLSHMLIELNLNNNLNDMQLLGSYKSDNLQFLPFDYNMKDKVNSKYIYDSCAIGQFLGGIDPRNIKDYNLISELERDHLILDNPSIKFINETCTFKLNNPNLNIFQRAFSVDNYIISLNLYYITNNEINIKQIVNTHIHSKQLNQFSSVFNIKYSDIITGDRIVTLCDFIITTNEIYKYHKNLNKFIKDDQIIIVNDFSNVNINVLNTIFNNHGKKTITLFIYTHVLSEFVDNILFKLDKKLNYKILLHNSDHALENNITYQKLLDCKHIEKVYSQNINCDFISNKFSLLPIGLANSMFSHGNILELYKIMKGSYYLNKTKNLYVNINPNTFHYRNKILEQFTLLGYTNPLPKPFKEYLEELSTHRFSLCIRGNGLSSHREWESYYLGVIPVIINNKFTTMNNHVIYMKSLGLPFYEITSDTFEKYTDDFFNEILYKKIIKDCGTSIYNLPQLKLNYYL